MDLALRCYECEFYRQSAESPLSGLCVRKGMDIDFRVSPFDARCYYGVPGEVLSNEEIIRRGEGKLKRAE